MAHDAMRLADQIAFTVERDPAEHVIGVSDAAARIGLADDDLVGAEAALGPGRLRMRGGRRAWHEMPRSMVGRSEEHTSELQSLMRISYAVFCLKKKKTYRKHNSQTH